MTTVHKLVRKLSRKNKQQTQEPSLLLEKIPDPSELIGDYFVSLNLGSAWREVRFVYTKKLLAFASAASSSEIIDVVPLHEISAIRAGQVEGSILMEESQSFSGMDVEDSSGEQAKFYTLDTEADGYNSGRSYKLRASQKSNQSLALIIRDLEKVTATAKERALARSQFRTSQARVKRVLDSLLFQKTIAVFIIANFGLDISSAQQHPKMYDDDGEATEFRKNLDRANLIFSLIFAAELAAVVYANWFRQFFEDYWNILDAVVIIASLVTLGETNYSVLRMVRVFRIIRVFGKFRSFRKLLLTVTSCLIPIFCTFLVIIVIVSLYSILGVSLFAELAPSAFGAFDKAFVTMFLVLASGNWTSTVPLVYPDGTTYVSSALFYISYYMVQGWIVLQFCTAVLVESFAKASFVIEMQEIHEALEARRQVDSYHDPLDPLLAKLYNDYRDDRDLSERLHKLFKVLDTDKQGFLKSHEIASSLKKLNLSQRIHFTSTDFDNLTQRGKLCNEEGALECSGFEVAMRIELKRYSMSQLASTSSRSPQEAASAQIGALKAALLHLHALERDQQDMERKLADMKDRMEKGVSRENGKNGSSFGEGMVAVGAIEDLFRHIARPICDRLEKVVAPLRMELSEIRAAVSTAHPPSMIAPHGSGGCVISENSQKGRHSVVGIRSSSNEEVVVTNRDLSDNAAVVVGERAGLKGWAEGLGLQPLVRLANWVDHSLHENDGEVRPPNAMDASKVKGLHAADDSFESRGGRVEPEGRHGWNPKFENVTSVSVRANLPSDNCDKQSYAGSQVSASFETFTPRHPKENTSQELDSQTGSLQRKTVSLKPRAKRSDRMTAKLEPTDQPIFEEEVIPHEVVQDTERNRGGSNRRRPLRTLERFQR